MAVCIIYGQFRHMVSVLKHHCLDWDLLTSTQIVVHKAIHFVRHGGKAKYNTFALRPIANGRYEEAPACGAGIEPYTVHWQKINS